MANALAGTEPGEAQRTSASENPPPAPVASEGVKPAETRAEPGNPTAQVAPHAAPVQSASISHGSPQNTGAIPATQQDFQNMYMARMMANPMMMPQAPYFWQSMAVAAAAAAQHRPSQEAVGQSSTPNASTQDSKPGQPENNGATDGDRTTSSIPDHHPPKGDALAQQVGPSGAPPSEQPAKPAQSVQQAPPAQATPQSGQQWQQPMWFNPYDYAMMIAQQQMAAAQMQSQFYGPQMQMQAQMQAQALAQMQAMQSNAMASGSPETEHMRPAKASTSENPDSKQEQAPQGPAPEPAHNSAELAEEGSSSRSAIETDKQASGDAKVADETVPNAKTDANTEAGEEADAEAEAEAGAPNGDAEAISEDAEEDKDGESPKAQAKAKRIRKKPGPKPGWKKAKLAAEALKAEEAKAKKKPGRKSTDKPKRISKSVYSEEWERILTARLKERPPPPQKSRNQPEPRFRPTPLYVVDAPSANQAGSTASEEEQQAARALLQAGRMAHDFSRQHSASSSSPGQSLDNFSSASPYFPFQNSAASMFNPGNPMPMQMPFVPPGFPNNPSGPFSQMVPGLFPGVPGMSPTMPMMPPGLTPLTPQAPRLPQGLQRRESDSKSEPAPGAVTEAAEDLSGDAAETAVSKEKDTEDTRPPKDDKITEDSNSAHAKQSPQSSMAQSISSPQSASMPPQLSQPNLMQLAFSQMPNSPFYPFPQGTSSMQPFPVQQPGMQLMQQPGFMPGLQPQQMQPGTPLGSAPQPSSTPTGNQPGAGDTDADGNKVIRIVEDADRAAARLGITLRMRLRQEQDRLKQEVQNNNQEGQPRLTFRRHRVKSQPVVVNESKAMVVPLRQFDGRFKCSMCDKTFKHAKHVRRHGLNHSDVRLYQCELCNTTFNRNDSLGRHLLRCQRMYVRDAEGRPLLSMPAGDQGTEDDGYDDDDDASDAESHPKRRRASGSSDDSSSTALENMTDSVDADSVAHSRAGARANSSAGTNVAIDSNSLPSRATKISNSGATNRAIEVANGDANDGVDSDANDDAESDDNSGISGDASGDGNGGTSGDGDMDAEDDIPLIKTTLVRKGRPGRPRREPLAKSKATDDRTDAGPDQSHINDPANMIKRQSRQSVYVPRKSAGGFQPIQYNGKKPRKGRTAGTEKEVEQSDEPDDEPVDDPDGEPVDDEPSEERVDEHDVHDESGSNEASADEKDVTESAQSTKRTEEPVRARNTGRRQRQKFQEPEGEREREGGRQFRRNRTATRSSR